MLARPGLPKFEYIKAQSPQEVFDLLTENPGQVRMLMGGTDLFVQIRDRSEGPDFILDMKDLPGMQEIVFHKKKGLQIGAAVSFNKLSAHPEVKKNYPLLAESAETVGNYQLRNRATLGGNVCNASPGADLFPACLVLEGEASIRTPDGERVTPLSEFWAGPGKTTLQENDYLQKIVFPIPPEQALGTYLKLGRSKMGDLAIVGVAVLGYPDPEEAAEFKFRIGVNSTAPVAYRVPEAEDYLANHPVSEESILKAAEIAMSQSAPIEDVRATAEYQRLMVRNLTKKALTEIWEQLKERS